MNHEMLTMRGVKSVKKILKLDTTITIIRITSVIDKKELNDAFTSRIKKVLKKFVSLKIFKKTLSVISLYSNIF